LFFLPVANAHTIQTLYDIAIQSHNGAVIHATAETIDENLVRRTDYTDAYLASSTGFAVLASHSVQEAYDMAVVAQISAIRGKASVLHVLDGARVAQQTTQVSTVDGSVLIAEAKRAAEQVSAKVPFAQTVDKVFADLEKHFGRRYRPFEYVGDANAKVVFVSIGGDATIFVEAVSKAGQAAGVLKVRLYRPWDAETFLRALPKTAEKVVVWESVLDESAYLFKDVAATLARQRSTASVVRLLPSDKVALTPTGAARVAKAASSATKQILDLADYAFGESLIGASAGEYIFWSSSDVDAAGLTAKIASQAGTDGRTSRFVAHDALLPQAITKAEVRIGAAGPASAPHRVHDADITVCLSDSVFASYNIALDAKQGSTLLFNTPLSDADLDAALPLALKQTIFDKKLNVFAVDATLISKNYTTFVGKSEEYLELILRGLFFQLRSDADGVKALETIRRELLTTETNFTVLRTKIIAIERAIAEVRVVAPLSLVSTAEAQPELKADVAGTIRLDGAGLVFGDDEEVAKVSAHKSHVAAWNVIFWESVRLDSNVGSNALPSFLSSSDLFSSLQSMRPDVAEARVATITSNVRVTPESYDRNVFHMEIDISKTGLSYQMGDALAVHGLNDEAEVDAFLAAYGINPADVVVMPRRNVSGKEVSDTVTARQLFTMYLDLLGKPGKKFYQDLAGFAKSSDQKHKLKWIGTPEGEAEFKRRSDETYTYADLLLEFTSAKVPLDALARIVPAIKPRAYSISSSASMHPTSVHLLVVLVDWQGKDGKPRTGQCSRYLAALRPGQPIIVSLTPSVMKLPADPKTPVIMSGLGTGMAPFRAFIQDRAVSKQGGADVGDMSLYFGSRHRAMEYLYGEDLDAYHQDALLTDLRLAFSRDQDKKIYIQHKISEDGDRLFDLLTRQKGHFYLCGPTWPVPDIKAALIKAFVKGGYTADEAEEYLEQMKEEERYVLEVY
jgi:sulfite reductase (NADPH) flavoprotein alpha-component